MAKKYDISLNTNQKLSELIDTELQKESKLLQNLINDVVTANQKVKSSHHQRIEETRVKLEKLNAEIERLKDEINQKEKETTMAQLNYLLESKNKIYQALQEMRQKNIDVYTKRDSTANTEPLRDMLFEYLNAHTEAHSDVLPLMKTLREHTLDFIEDGIANMETILKNASRDEDVLKETVDGLTSNVFDGGKFFASFKDSLLALEDERTHILQEEESEDALEARIEKTFKDRTDKIDQKIEALDAEFKKDKEALLADKKDIYEKTLSKLKEKHKGKLEAEKETKENLQNALKQLRLDIMSAEKEGREERVKNLIRDYQKLEHKDTKFFEEKLEKQAEEKVKAELKKIDNKLYRLEKQYIDDAHALRFEREKVRIEKSDSKDMFKVREDHKGLKGDLEYNAQLKNNIEDTLDAFETALDQVLSFKRTLQDEYIRREGHYLNTQVDMMDDFNTLEKTFKSMQLDLSRLYREKHFKDRILREKIKREIRMHALQINKHQKFARIDKRLTDEENLALVKQLADEEDIQNEKIYQNALIELADKEYQLQLLKIQSLYDNEIGLTKAQAERLNIGYDVNESMVSTTLESQILFAKQQIEYAKSEYELRLENIETSLNKEKEYAEEKLREHQQKYKTDKLDIIKERDRKLEDLSYKQALFTDDKDRRDLKEKEDRIRENYDKRIEAINEAENNDPYVKRYKKQLDNANERAEKAREDAKHIRDQSIQTFENMLKTSEEKLHQFKNNKEHASVKPMIETEESTAKNRFNESIEDAKKLYEEKTEAPKQKLEELDEKLKHIQDKSGLQDKISPLLEEKEAIKQQYEADAKALNETHNQTIEAIELERKDFITQFDQAKTQIDAKNDTAASEQHKRTIKQTLNATSKTLEKQNNEIKNRIVTELKRFKKELPSRIKGLNQAIEKAHKEYNGFLGKLSSNTAQREKKVKKTIDSDHRDALRQLKLTYGKK